MAKKKKSSGNGANLGIEAMLWDAVAKMWVTIKAGAERPNEHE